ncbi:MAG: hypothetical protein AAF556_07520 [Pseudomonadota bacterium]
MASDKPTSPAPAAANAARDERGFPTDGSYVDLTDQGPADPTALKIWRAKRFTGIYRDYVKNLIEGATLQTAEIYDAGIVMRIDVGDAQPAIDPLIDETRAPIDPATGDLDKSKMLQLIEAQPDGTALVYQAGDKQATPHAYSDVYTALERTLIRQDGQPPAALVKYFTASRADRVFNQQVPASAPATPGFLM